MSGLLEKDLRLILQRKRTIMILFLVMMIMCLSNEQIFIIGYGTMLFGIFTIATQSYDDYENSVPYLLTLPVTRKDYVKEKFLFCGFGLFIGWLLSFMIGLTGSVLQGNGGVFLSQWMECLLLFPIFFAMLSIKIPIQLKYGAECSRIALAIIGGGVFGISEIASILEKKPGLKLSIFEKIGSLPDGCILVLLIFISFGIIFFMYRWSLKIMEQKEY